jgi:hypothetical protein
MFAGDVYRLGYPKPDCKRKKIRGPFLTVKIKSQKSKSKKQKTKVKSQKSKKAAIGFASKDTRKPRETLWKH